MNDQASYIATTNSPRSPIRSFDIYQADRLQHVNVIGQTGTGKSTLLYRLGEQGMGVARSIAAIDPYGLMICSPV